MARVSGTVSRQINLAIARRGDVSLPEGAFSSREGDDGWSAGLVETRSRVVTDHVVVFLKGAPPVVSQVPS